MNVIVMFTITAKRMHGHHDTWVWRRLVRPVNQLFTGYPDDVTKDEREDTLKTRELRGVNQLAEERNAQIITCESNTREKLYMLVQHLVQLTNTVARKQIEKEIPTRDEEYVS